MQQSSGFSDTDLIRQLANDDVKALEHLFNRYYRELCRYAMKYVSNGAVAEEIVSAIFTQIWEMRYRLQITTSGKAYLYTAAKNASLNYVKSQYARQQFQSEMNENQHPAVSSPNDELQYQELQAIIQNGISALPERCRIIFTLSRNAGLSYEEIAAELGISKKTVKAQMGIALQKLRGYVGRHWGKMLMVLVNML
jgi:RNA polymerase sigma-70 factor (ECF subfamily)